MICPDCKVEMVPVSGKLTCLDCWYTEPPWSPPLIKKLQEIEEAEREEAMIKEREAMNTT